MTHKGSLTHDDIVMLQELMTTILDPVIVSTGIWCANDYDMLNELITSGLQQLNE